jgi:low temperature requirement protein LtrA
MTSSTPTKAEATLLRWNPWAIVAMACVLFLLVGVLAVYFGNKALREIKKTNQRGMKLAQWAVVFGYVEIVSGVIVLTAILAITY